MASNMTEPNSNQLPYTHETPYFDPFGTFYPSTTLEPGGKQIPYDWSTMESTIDYSADWDLPPNSAFDAPFPETASLLPKYQESIQNNYGMMMESEAPVPEFDEFLDFSSHQDSHYWSTAASLSTATASSTSTTPLQTPITTGSLSPSTPTSSRSLSSTSISPRRLSPNPSKPIYICPTCAKPYSARHLLNRHTRKHTLPFTCYHTQPDGTPCSVRKPNAREMERHIAQAHTKETLGGLCPFGDCKYSRVTPLGSGRKRFQGFARKDHLTRHLKNIHPGEVP